MADLRNFRSAYLEKVGIKGVEEKKSLAILLKEQPLDINKLIQFCLRFPVPAIYRPYLWKVLLDVLPRQQGDCQTEVAAHRQEQYDMLLDALQVMQKLHSSLPLCHSLLLMYLLQEGRLPFDDHSAVTDDDNCDFVAICNVMSKVTEEPVDIFWLTSRFYRLRCRSTDMIIIMVGRVEDCVDREDTSAQLSAHLRSVGAYTHLPLLRWFSCCFAGVLPEPAVIRIWDKLVGGSSMVLVYVAVAILLTLKRPIMSLGNPADIQNYLSQIADDSGDIIVNKGIELWQKHGSPLLVTRSDSPDFIDKVCG